MFRKDQQIGIYTLVQPLGRGGFGEVWLAERRTKFVTTKVAVKLPLDEQVDHEAVKHEATLWEQASGHPNILPIIDADEYDGQIVIVSEYAPDGSLEQWLKTHGAMSVERAIEMTIQILDGLEFLHSRNIIHRDLKPANILLQGTTPRLADFGISRALRTTVASQSQNISGTFAYMSPEALDGKRSVQTDVWSVGVNLYQFLTGTLPFPQKEPSVLFPAIIMREFAPLPDSISQSLQNVIAKALAKQPENRYKAADEMRENLRRVLRGETVSDSVQSDSRQKFSTEQIPPTQKSVPFSAQNLQDENETVVRSASSFGQSEKPESSNVWMYATLALVLVSAIGIGIYFLANQSKQNSSDKNEAAQVSAMQLSNNSVNSENTNVNIIENTHLATPVPVASLDKKQVQKLVRKYTDNLFSSTDLMLGDDNEGRQKILYGDVDGDSDEDVIVGIELVSYRGSNPDVEGYYLLIFQNNNGQLKFSTKSIVGKSILRSSTESNLARVNKEKIYLETSYYRDEDFDRCCPTNKAQSIFVLNGNKVVESK